MAMSYRSVLPYSIQNGSGAKQASHRMGTGTFFPTGNEDSAEVGMCEAILLLPLMSSKHKHKQLYLLPSSSSTTYI
jgi:hypothetical protein